MNERELQKEPGSEAERQQTQQRTQDPQQGTTFERARELLAESNKRLLQAENNLGQLQQRHLELTADPNSDAKEIAKLQKGMDRQQQEYDRLETRCADLTDLERRYDHDPRMQALRDRRIEQYEQDKDLAYISSSLEAQSQAFQRHELREMQKEVENPDSGQAIRDVEARTQAFEENGYATKEMSDVRSILNQEIDPAEMREELKMLLKDLEDAGAMNVNSLEKDGRGLTIGDVPELRKAWELAQDQVELRGNSPNDYNKVRTEWYKLMHPRSEATDAQRDAGKAAREFFEAAGTSFEDVEPGRAPRLVSSDPLSRNDCTLSLQHDIPQHQVRMAGGDLNKLLTAPENLRFVTARDNLQEDAVRFGRSSNFMGGIEDRVRDIREGLKDIVNDAGTDLSKDAHVALRSFVKQADQRLSQTGDWERQALREVKADFDTLRELRTRCAVELHKFNELMAQPAPDNHAEISKQQERETEVQQNADLLEYQNDQAQQLVRRQMADVGREMREALENIEGRAHDDEAWARVLLEIAERIAELENEAGLLPKR